ncbi:hypothetical protein ACOSQ2_002193 [Xanthoceras sorbifolium]
MKMAKSGSEQHDHQCDQGTARCARDEGGANTPVSTATWWRDHRSRQLKNIYKKKRGFSQKPENRTARRERRDRGKKERKRRKKKEKEKEEEEERKKKKEKEEEEEEEEEGKREKGKCR